MNESAGGSGNRSVQPEEKNEPEVAQSASQSSSPAIEPFILIDSQNKRIPHTVLYLPPLLFQRRVPTNPSPSELPHLPSSVDPRSGEATALYGHARRLSTPVSGTVLGGLLGALDSHEFVFGRPMGLADTLRLVGQTITGITPKAGTDSLAVAENAENQDQTSAVQTKNARDPIATARRQRRHPVRNRDDPECAPHRDTRGSPTAHGAAPLEAQRPPSMSMLAARRASTEQA
ncbi:hypothetical protein EDB83DRAFT_2316186 [Lactarius deliciosus]|nr:hypothetical protein EDB83DRAFT_2316186 [Lactarius deliciosus]